MVAMSRCAPNEIGSANLRAIGEQIWETAGSMSEEPYSNSGARLRFVAGVFPWFVGLGALVFYLFTLNRWVSLYSLGNVARVSGWLWRPQLEQPLTFLLLSPFRLLPESWVPLALNGFTAI